MDRREDLERIREALERARAIFAKFTPGEVAHRFKEGDDPLTAADTEVNDELLRTLPREGEGWLSEETVDDPIRLQRSRVWIVDPLDGTREFVKGIPEWCCSIALVEDGRPVAGGILNPVTDQLVLGAVGSGVTLNGEPCAVRKGSDLAGREVLASRSEIKRGEWERFASAQIEVRPMGSVAYKMSLVAAGLSDATWTLVPKHEWDVAAGTALIVAAGGEVWCPDGSPVVFNREVPKFTGLVSVPADLAEPVRNLLGE
jgi:myo-inositol-1(or 4)-monophosphatase